MTPRSIRKAWLCLLFAVASCGEQQSAQERNTARIAGMDELFIPVRSIVLEEPDSAPIGVLEDLEVLPDGKFLVVDRMNSQIRVHRSDGSLERIVGRSGEGPGEFTDVIDAAVSETGEIYTADFGLARVSRFRRDFTFDTVVASLPGPITDVRVHRGRILVSIRGPSGGVSVGYLDEAGGFNPFHKWDDAQLRNQYLAQVGVDHVAAGSATLIANSMTYPIRRYQDAGQADSSFGTPPQSWAAVQPPEMGQFSGPSGKTNLATWLNTFTVISGVNMISDSVVLVEHARYAANPSMQMPEMFRMHPYAFDVYHGSGRKLWSDVELKKRILLTDSLLYVEDSQPPEARQITVYRFRGGAGPVASH